MARLAAYRELGPSLIAWAALNVAMAWVFEVK